MLQSHCSLSYYLRALTQNLLNESIYNQLFPVLTQTMAFGSANCSIVPETTSTDAGVAGVGTLLSFIITNFVSLFLSAIIILLGLRKTTSAPICRKLLSGFSDTQILQGIGIQCVALAKIETLIPYHFFIVWLLSMLSTATNLATLLALVNDFKRDWVLRWMRQLFMATNMGLQCVSGIFILQSVMKNLEPRLPIACVWEVEGRGATSNAALSIAGTIAVIAGNVVVFIAGTWYLHMRKNPRWLKSVQVIGLVMLIAMGIGATIRVVMESQAFGSPPEAVRLVGTGEKDFGYGQLLALLFLILPVISALEIVRGELRVTPNKADDDGDEKRLVDTEYSQQDYQPNPLFGSRGNLLGK
ncbi:hypothetical protein M011DRAFT_467806 [Sporormia fimetaria CBS 119925]|uniref:Uncharacterized protein n=1 Tax=Sporormia fimetaria CBS 119925 TaxID=1340428 RepID=A0A6A6VC41_9PLEO|nr:hypothetical protein M011DRAFT_467806 [Sporormia fimetaria CBS 119925]